ncbi:MAG: hypothetical protein RJA81_1425, partial [Planctomycetota bacterium]
DREYPSIATDPKSRAVVAVWASATRSDSGNSLRTLWISRSTDAGRQFSKPVAFREVPVYAFVSGAGKPGSKDKNVDDKPSRPPMTFSTHLLPRLVPAGDRLVLTWVEAVNGGPKAALYLSISTDGGLHFSDPVNIAGDSAQRPGFVAINSSTDGRILAAWLDNPPSKSANGSKSGGTKVFAVQEKRDQSGFEQPVLLYDGPEGQGVCPCCDVSVAGDSDGHMYYAFRNNVDDIRDIWTGSFNQAKAIQPPIPLSRREWKFAGCPHDGPSMILQNGTLSTAWMDAKDGKPRVFLTKVTSSQMSSEKMTTQPLTAILEGAQSHIRLLDDGHGGIFAAWDQAELKQNTHHEMESSETEPQKNRRGIVIAHKPADSSRLRSRVNLIADPARLPRNPVMTMADGGIVVSWAEIGGDSGKTIVIQRVELNEMQLIENEEEIQPLTSIETES